MSKILHNRYNNNGELIEQFWVEVSSNEDDYNIYLTDKWIHNQAKHGHVGDTSESNFTDYEKTVWYRSEGNPDRKVISMKCKKNVKSYEVIFVQPDGNKIEVFVPVK